MTDKEINKEINKRKKALIKFLRDPSIDLGEIEEGGGHWVELYTYKGRFYKVDKKGEVIYGDWYHDNYYEDIGDYRCSYHMYLLTPSYDERVKPTYTLCVGGEHVYTWKGRPRHYTKKTVKQLDIIADSFIKELKENLSTIDFDLEIARETIRYHLEQLYLRHDFQYKDKRLRNKHWKEIREHRAKSKYYKDCATGRY